jgi:hypothetical protein
MTQANLQTTQDPTAGSMAQPECPQQDRQQPQSFRLIGSAIAFRIVSKSPMTTTATIPIHSHLPDMYILDRLPDLSPTLKDFPFTIWTLFGSLFSFSLDIRQFQDHNRHHELLVSGDLLQSPSYKKLVSLSIPQNPPLLLQSQVTTEKV